MRDTGYFRQPEKQFDQCVSFWQAATANCEKYRFLSLWKATHNICSRALEVKEVGKVERKANFYWDC